MDININVNNRLTQDTKTLRYAQLLVQIGMPI